MMCFDVRCGEGQAAFRLDHRDGQLVNCGYGPPTTNTSVHAQMM